MEDKLLELMTKIYSEMQDMKSDMNNMKEKVKEIKSIQLRMENSMTENFKTLYDAREVNLDNHKRIEEKIDTIHHELSTIEKVTIKNTADIIDLQSYRKEN